METKGIAPATPATERRQRTPLAVTRERVLGIAEQMFRQSGVQAVSVDAIAQAAGIKKMTLYRCFPSKEELVMACMDQWEAAFRRIWDRSGSARTPLQPTPAKAKRRSKYAASRNSPKHSPVFALNRETTLFKKDGSPRLSKRYPPLQSSQSIKSLLPASPQAQKTNRESREQGFDKREVLRVGVRGRTLLSKSALPRLCFTHSATPRTPCRGYAPGSPEGATPRRGGRAVPSSG